MADSKTVKAEAPAPVVKTGDRDRVVSLSINKEGAPDQTPDFEIIGDKDFALAATKKQFAEIAVAAVDAEKRAELGLAGTADTGPSPDKAIDALKAEHDKAVAASDKKAEAIVNARHEG